MASVTCKNISRTIIRRRSQSYGAVSRRSFTRRRTSIKQKRQFFCSCKTSSSFSQCFILPISCASILCVFFALFTKYFMSFYFFSTCCIRVFSSKIAKTSSALSNHCLTRSFDNLITQYVLYSFKNFSYKL